MVSAMYELASPVTSFVEEHCVVEPGAEVPRRDLYRAYTDWLKENGRDHHEDQAGFGRALRAAFPEITDVRPRISGDRVRCYRGIRLRLDY